MPPGNILLRIDASIHGRPSDAAPGPPAILGGRSWPTWQVPPGVDLQLRVSFDDLCAALEPLERLFLEPDGSWVWVGGDPAAWQLDGQIHDGGPSVAYVEVKGTCPPPAWDRLLAACGSPPGQLLFQPRGCGIFLDAPTALAFATFADH